jgi:hypothetical protein
MSNADISLNGMTVEEKLHLMERIWVDLSQKPDDVPSPQWHGDILVKRLESVRSGESKFEDWETVKEQLLNRYK